MKRVAHRLAIGVTTALVAGVVGWWWLHEPRKPAGSTAAGLESRTKGTPASVAPASATGALPDLGQKLVARQKRLTQHVASARRGEKT